MSVLPCLLLAAAISALWLRDHRKLSRELNVERRQHGDTKNELASARLVIRETEPLRDASRVALDNARRTADQAATIVANVRQDNYLLRQILAESLRRGAVGPLEADRIEERVREVLRDRSPVPVPDSASTSAERTA